MNMYDSTGIKIHPIVKKDMARGVMAVCCILFASHSAFAQTVCDARQGSCYYVSPVGGGDCSFESPCTISEALVQLGAGDVMYLRQGTYGSGIMIDKYFNFSPAPTPELPVTIAAYPGETPVIRRSDEPVADNRWCNLIDGESNIIIDGLTIQNCWEAGIRIGYDAPTSNITVRNCDFSEIHCNDNMGGVYIHSAENILIENNTFHDNVYNSRDGLRHTQGKGLTLFGGIDITVRNNEFYNLGSGLYYKHGERQTGRGGYTRFIGNYFHDITGKGLATNQNRSEIRNNILVGTNIRLHNEDGTQADFTFDIQIENNTLVNSGIVLWRGGAFSGAKRTTVRNNILYNSSYHIWVYGSDTQYNQGIGHISDGNCFYQSDSQQTIEYFSSDNPAYGGENTGGSYSLSQWQQQDFGDGSIEADPLFSGLAAHNYGLQEGSPCIGKGSSREVGSVAPGAPGQLRVVR